ncbi:MAG: hypothetical protein KDB03_10210 [Planctomycetales bacterium]|nr:hypothetical protein [Planctomycetales bacterium]
MFSRLPIFSCLLVAYFFSSSATAQRELNVKKKFEPAFHIEPLVNRIKAKQGDVVQFQFEVMSVDKDSDIEVLLVGLRQEQTGQVYHDEALVDSDEIRLISAGRAAVARDVPYLIEGIIRVPSGEAKFHSYGILVRDFGTSRSRQPTFDPSGKELTTAGINFITQYLLRVDLEIQNARGDNVKELVLESGSVVAAMGKPQIVTVIRNPTASTFEFQIQAQLKRSPTDRSFQSASLVMPIRMTTESDERFVGRLLPYSSVFMQQLMSEPVLTGDYQLEVKLQSEGRVIQQKSFAVAVDSADFPAQETQLKQVGSGLYISPTAIEISQARGGTRRISVELMNQSDKPRVIDLSAISSRGTPFDVVQISPDKLTLAPGRSRKISLSLKRNSDRDQAIEYGQLLVSSQDPNQSYDEKSELPLAVTFAEPDPPVVDMEALRWVGTGKYPSFRAKVTNTGGSHLVLEARLLVIPERGERLELPAGYGQWLMPGESLDLDFRLARPLTPGNYRLICELQNNGVPIIRSETIEVTDFDAASTTASR